MRCGFISCRSDTSRRGNGETGNRERKGTMPHDTLLKFNYPQTLLREYQHWAVLLRPKQVTVGSLVLICTEEATRVSDVSPGAFAELKTVTTDLETTLQKSFA